MNRREFDDKFPKGTQVAALNAKIGAVVARAVMYITRARAFRKGQVQYAALLVSADQLLGYAQKMSDEKKSLMAAPSSDEVVVTPEQQEVLNAVEDCIAKKKELHQELWDKFWEMFGGEIEFKDGNKSLTVQKS
ncbi:MAG: hypothetical protein FJ395_21995 [Verrucomicrobia bacterium]|nr:hypothetical protein [Verrucomicrobiota bacterium]